MAELATIARPYAEALFKATGTGDLSVLSKQVQALGDVAGHAQLRQFADNPKARVEQVFEVIVAVVQQPLAEPAKNLLRAVIDKIGRAHV
jgi:F-type H+-transporting ATPase subunit delta